MNKFIKLNALILTVFMIFAVQLKAAERILPLAKPLIDQEVKKKIAKKKTIYPKKKPQKQKSEDKIENNNEIVDSKENSDQSNDKIVFIYPEKKPIIVQKRINKPILNSTILSKKNFKIAKKTFEAIEKNSWQTALKLSKKSNDEVLYKLVNYLYLKKTSNNATFYDYARFIENNPEFPRINRLRYLAEHKINLKTNPPSNVLKWFGEKEPLSDFGKIKLGEIFLLEGKIEESSRLIKEGWEKARLSKSDLKYLRKKYKNIITIQDNIKRADWHAWEGKYWDLQRMLRYLPKDYTALYRARQLLMSKSYGVDKAISDVPEKFKNDIGLRYDRLKWRRKRGRLDPSLEILFKLPRDSSKLVRPDIWWKERAILTRSLIYKKKYAVAYKVSSNHSLIEGPEYAEAEWLSGWIALTFLDDPNLALSHFENFFNNVGYPISLSRGAYWIGRSYKTLKNEQKSNEWFAEASKYLNTYYGQLAFVEIKPGESFSLIEQKKISKKFKKRMNKNISVKIIKLLSELNKSKYSKDFLKHLAMLDVNEGSEVFAGQLAVEIGRYDFAIQISKSASYEKRFYNELNYPVIATPETVNEKKMPKPELVLAVIRQESEFDQRANSSAGAQGLMQLMTYTAKLVSKQAKLPYSKSRLKNDPHYNIKLGSYYLASLLESYEGSYPFALAAYNAGPKRVKYWKKINGNPQSGKINYVDWVELIKFKETRNYVQRVLENINVYRYMLNDRPIKIHNFFEDKPHY
jgi:soluble lytic murein transglycosylase